MSKLSFWEMVKRWVWRPYETPLADGADHSWLVTTLKQSRCEVDRAFRRGQASRRLQAKSRDRARQYAKDLLAEAYQGPKTIERDSKIKGILRHYHAYRFRERS